MILTKYLVYAAVEVLCSLSIGPSPKTKISLFLFSGNTEKLLSIQKTITFLPHAPIDNENCEHASNPIPKPL